MIRGLFKNVLAQQQSVCLGVVPQIWYLLWLLNPSSNLLFWAALQELFSHHAAQELCLPAGHRHSSFLGIRTHCRSAWVTSVTHCSRYLSPACNTSGIVYPSQLIVHQCDLLPCSSDFRVRLFTMLSPTLMEICTFKWRWSTAGDSHKLLLHRPHRPGLAAPRPLRAEGHRLCLQYTGAQG